MDMEEVVDDVNEVLHRGAREQRRVASRPYIDGFPDAVREKDGKMVCTQTKDMRIIIERYATILSTKPWLDTKTYIVNGVNQDTGEIKLWDEDLEHHVTLNFITGTKLGYRFKVPPTKGPLLPRHKPDEEKPVVASASKSERPTRGPTERRIYSTKGILHTRLKGLAYVPPKPTKAIDGMRLLTLLEGNALKVSHPVEGWVETWTPNQNL